MNYKLNLICLTKWTGLTAIVQLLLLLFLYNSSFAQPDGREIFKNKCLKCHTIGAKKVGADLKNVHKRRTKEWISKFISSPKNMIEVDKDPYAVALRENFDITMPDQELTDDELSAVIDFIAETSDADETITTATIRGVRSTDETGVVAEEESGGLNITTVAVGLFLFIGIFVVIIFFWYKKVIAYTVAGPIITLLVLGTVTFIGFQLYTMGVQQGYKPDQPIKFSHKLHAGRNKIPCLYCHFGAEKSRHAGIPPVNVCMNCHSVVTQRVEAEKESPEIQKIYRAVREKKSIQWIKIHNIPDFVYFNHSQHVVVGAKAIRQYGKKKEGSHNENIKNTCQTCHGEIDKMDVVEQYAPLTMGWCLDCHLNSQIKGKKEKGFVAKAGGTNCVRCHY